VPANALRIDVHCGTLAKSVILYDVFGVRRVLQTTLQTLHEPLRRAPDRITPKTPYFIRLFCTRPRPAGRRGGWTELGAFPYALYAAARDRS
jgi:hypothetical protein